MAWLLLVRVTFWSRCFYGRRSAGLGETMKPLPLPAFATMPYFKLRDCPYCKGMIPVGTRKYVSNYKRLKHCGESACIKAHLATLPVHSRKTKPVSTPPPEVDIATLDQWGGGGQHMQLIWDRQTSY